MREGTAKPPRPITLADLPEDVSMRELRAAWSQQPGIKLLRTERARQYGRRQRWELWRYTPPRPPKDGPLCSYVITIWDAGGWETAGPFVSRAEALTWFRQRGRMPQALFPPLFGE